MPSYIELNKQVSVPSASDASKIILSINSSGQVTTTDNTGQTSPVGGGGLGITIPKPIPYSTKNPIDHSFNQLISSLGDGSGVPGAVIASPWNNDILKLTYQTDDLSFLSHNPKYFLFVYYKSGKMGGLNSPQHPNTRANNNKYGRYFAHPSSYTGSYIDDGMGGWNPSFTSTATYTNFSNGGDDFGGGANPRYTSSFTAFTTEWSVATGSGQPTLLTDFDPLRFYWFKNDIDAYQYRGKSFFPFRTDFATGSNTYAISTATNHTYRRWAVDGSQTANGVTTYGKPRVNLYCKFAIVIQNPNNPSNYIIGPMSDTIKIFPMAGYFEDDVDTGNTYKYYYKLTWQLA